MSYIFSLSRSFRHTTLLSVCKECSGSCYFTIVQFTKNMAGKNSAGTSGETDIVCSSYLLLCNKPCQNWLSKQQWFVFLEVHSSLTDQDTQDSFFTQPCLAPQEDGWKSEALNSHLSLSLSLSLCLAFHTVKFGLPHNLIVSDSHASWVLSDILLGWMLWKA
jgi:hypothetical protein